MKANIPLLYFQVQGLSMGADPQTDVNVTVGQVTFEDKQTSGTLELQVMPDDVSLFNLALSIESMVFFGQTGVGKVIRKMSLHHFLSIRLIFFIILQ